MPGTTQIPAAASPPLCAAGETEAQTWPCPCPSTPWTRSGAEGHPCVPPSLQNGAGDTTSHLESRTQPSPIPPGPSQPPLRTPRPRKAPGHPAPPSPWDTPLPPLPSQAPRSQTPSGGAAAYLGRAGGGCEGPGGFFWGGAGWDRRAALRCAALSTSRAAAACGRGSAPSLQPPVVKTTRDGAAACKGCKNHPGGGSGHPPSMKTPWAVGHPLAAGSSRVGARRAFLCAPGVLQRCGSLPGGWGCSAPAFWGALRSGVPLGCCGRL